MHRRTIIVVLLLFGLPGFSNAAEQSVPPASSGRAQQFDVKAAVDAYLASVPAEARARSDAYFEGGYWLILWDFLYAAAISLILLGTRASAKMREASERIMRFKPLQTVVYWFEYLLLVSVLGFPLTVYEGFFRERKYGLMNQTFPQWLGDQSKALMLGLVLGAILVTALFGVVRLLQKTWWIWGSVVTIAFLMFASFVSPVYIAPLFNKYTPISDERVKQPILSMARANGIPATEVWEVDASRQSKRVSANVSGFLGTERITLNDNLLNRCTLPEIETVMGHEMGHYVLNHILKDVLFFGLVVLCFFGFLRWALHRSLMRWGERWGIRGVGDTAIVPLVLLIGSTFFLLITPVTNSWIRMQEYEADIFGLNAAMQPDGEAKVDLMLGEYRKLDPGPWEETLFFDHPSGRTRITAAMRWKAEHLGGSPQSGR